MKDNKYIKELCQINSEVQDRHVFHQKSGELLVKMASDKTFWNEVFKQNLTDKGYLHHKWTMYEIPFFYVFENDDFYVKVHLFVPLKTNEPHIAASAIHHHNNYLLTTYAAFGSGYECMLFEKQFQMDPTTKETQLKLREHFTQKERPLHMVDAWEPHLVFNPVSLSATLVLWSPDKKRATDSLRSNPVLKAMKKPLRKLIYAFGMDKKVGIAAKNTYQYYVKDEKFIAVPEDEFFAPTRAQAGPEVDDYSVQTIFAFMQRMNFDDHEFLKAMKSNPKVPSYYHKWINMIINNEQISDTYAKDTINVPKGKITVDDILCANKMVNKL
jgi:hypothetical protein